MYSSGKPTILKGTHLPACRSKAAHASPDLHGRVLLDGDHSAGLARGTEHRGFVEWFDGVHAKHPAFHALFGQEFRPSEAGATVSPEAMKVSAVPWRTSDAFPSSNS